MFPVWLVSATYLLSLMVIFKRKGLEEVISRVKGVSYNLPSTVCDLTVVNVLKHRQATSEHLAVGVLRNSNDTTMETTEPLTKSVCK